MRKTLIHVAMLGSLLMLGACSASSLFDTNCSGNGMIENPGYCTSTLHPNAGPWAGGKAM
jgi:hypothetical protein